MHREFQPLDISNAPDLIRVAEEVRAGGRPRVLQRDQEDVALLLPIPVHGRRARSQRATALDGLRLSAGSWKGLLDADQLKREIKAARGSDRPDVTL